jgi:hypothetical protein
MHIDIQGGKFDAAQRVFSSLGACWDLVTSQLNDYRELLPEFFYEPEFLQNMNDFDLGVVDQHSIGNVELPPWAKSPMEFVYLNRKALESRLASEKLGLWIDLIFGCKQRGEASLAADNQYKEEMYDDIWEKEGTMDRSRRAEIEASIEQVGQVPPQLFTTAHEMRGFSEPAARLEQSLIVALPSAKYVFGLFSDELSRVYLLCANSEFVTVRFDLRSDQPLNVQFESFTSRFQFPNDLKDFVGVSDTAFAAVCNNDLECLLIDSENCTKVPMGRQRITAISSTESLLSVSSADARTHIFALSSGKLNERFAIPTYRNSILCSCLSKQFGVFVSGTDDRALIVGLLADGSTVRVIHLDFIPQKVIVTNGWGFIVVHGCAGEYVQGKPHYRFAVFNINGIPVKAAQFPGAVMDWIAVTSSRGFDFIIFSSERGKLFAFEVFFLDIGSPIHRCCCELACLGFAKKSNVIVAVTTDGKMHMVPFLLHTIEKYYA